MKLIVGLGNPGNKYKNNRHNVGFVLVDALASKLSKPPNLQTSMQIQNLNFKFQNKRKLLSEILKINNLVLAKQVTYMNDSGSAVKKLTDYYSLVANNLYIIHDDLDINLGEYKIQLGKGPKDHKGIISIDKALGTKDYWRVRVGVENRDQEIRNTKHEIRSEFNFTNIQNSKRKRISGEKYVLQDFTKDELEVVNDVVKDIVEEFKTRVLD
jgi:PTH1 family peptidyl-tRNA hydrolase